MTAAFNEPKYPTIIQPDERVFVDFEDPEISFLITQEVMVHSRTSADAKLKLFEFINPAPGLDSASFLGSWMKFASRLEASRVYGDLTCGYTCNITVPTGTHPRWPVPRYSGVTEAWFENMEQLREFYAARSSAAIREMENAFISRENSFAVLATEFVLYDRLAPGETSSAEAG
jgi:hypothetical protein